MKKILLLFVAAFIFSSVSGQIVASWKSKRVDPTNNKYYKVGTISLPNQYCMFNGTFYSTFQQIGTQMETSFIKYSIWARNTDGNTINLKIIHGGSSGKGSYSANVTGIINGTTIDIYAGGINVPYQYPSHTLLGSTNNVCGTFTKTENDEGTTTLPSGTQVSMNKSLFIEDSGNVGIGTTNPYRKLHVYSTASPTKYYDGEVIIGGFLGTSNDMALILGTHRNNSVSTLQSWKGGYGGYSLSLNPMGGNVGIGTISPAYKLDVYGTISATEIKVEAKTADYVFEKDFKLRSLDEVEIFVKENKHLPEIASAKEMEEDGVFQSEMNQKLLQKIEELTLYMIEMNKEVKALKNENELLKEEINTLKTL